MIEIFARILKFGDVVTGTTKNGNPYKKCDVTFAHSQRVNQQTGQPEFETIMMTVFNDKVDTLMQLQGQFLTVKFFSNVRESEKQPGRFYNDFNFWQAVPFQQNQQPNPQQYMGQQPPMQNLQQSMYAQPMYAPQMSAPFQGQPQGGFVAPQGTVQPTAQQQGMAQTGGGAPVGDMPF